MMDEEMNVVKKHCKSKYPNKTNIFEVYLFGGEEAYCYPGIFMVRMEHFDKCIKDREICISRIGQNLQLILPITYNVKCGYLNEVVYKYRIREDSHYHSVKGLNELIERAMKAKKLKFEILDKIDMLFYENKKYKELLDQSTNIEISAIYLNFKKQDVIIERLKSYFELHNIRSIIIYGMGNNGRKLYSFLKQIDIDVMYAIDKRAKKIYIEDLDILEPLEASKNADAIIITPITSYEEIYNEMKDRNLGRIINLMEVISFGMD